MDLYLIRHGDAAPVGQGGITADADRPLTPEGEAQAGALASALQQHGVSLNVVLFSPLVRARQTAEGLARHWAPPAPTLLVCEALAPQGKRKKLARFLARQGKNKVALVGHQPDLGQFAAWLIGSKKAQVDLGKGGVAWISCATEPAKGSGKLRWLITTEWASGGR